MLASLGKITLISPRLETTEHPTQHPPWKDVIRATWTYLLKYYTIIPEASSECGTTIQISHGRDCTLPELKKIAAAIIHFEPVLSVLVNQREEAAKTNNGSSTPIIKRNWRDNPRLGAGKAKLTRPQSIAAIESIQPNLKLGDIAPLLELVQPGNDEEYAWVLYRVAFDRVIQYRQAPACESGDDVIMWADLAVSFIEGALAYRSTGGGVQRIAPNHQGLRYFLSGVRPPCERKLGGVIGASPCVYS